MMKIGMFVAFFLVSFSTQAKTLICGDQQVKYGFNSSSQELYVTDAKVADTEVIQKGNEHGRISVSYDSVLDVFTASGEDGCTQVEMITQITDGKIQLLESDEYDGISTIVYDCRQLNN